MVSTVASGDVAAYVDASDIAMLYSVTDVAGLNRISRQVIGNAAHALAGMVAHPIPEVDDRPAVGLTMFGVTTPCVTGRDRAASATTSIRWSSMPPAPVAEPWRSWSTTV